VIAGLADYARPAEKLSVGQSSALAATGLLFSAIISVKIYYYLRRRKEAMFLGLSVCLLDYSKC